MQVQGLPVRHHGKPQRRKGAPTKVRQVSRIQKQAYGEATSAALRIYRRLHGRLSELERSGRHGDCSSSEVTKLHRKLARCPYYVPGMTAGQIAAQVQQLTKDETNARLRRRKNKLRSHDRELFRWLRAKPSPPTVNIYDDDDSAEAAATCDGHEVLQTLLQYWSRVWDRDNGPTEMDPVQYLLAFGPARQPEQQWSPVNTSKILRAAPKQHGQSAGLDGCSGTEVAMWPSNIWDDMTKVIQRWESVGHIPSGWREILQVHIPKPGSARQSDKAVPAGKLRPISMLPVFWRIYIAARMVEDALRNWLDSQLHPSQGEGRRGRDASSSFVSIAEAFATRHFVCTLDPRKAFDFVWPGRACATLAWHGFPSKLAQAVHALWAVSDASCRGVARCCKEHDLTNVLLLMRESRRQGRTNMWYRFSPAHVSAQSSF